MKQSDFCHAKTKRPKRKMVLATYNRNKILPRYPVNLKLYRKKKLENLKWFKFKMDATFGKRKNF